VHKNQMRIEFRQAPVAKVLLHALHQLEGTQFSLHSEGERAGVTLRPVSHPKEALALLAQLGENLKSLSTQLL